MIDLLAVSEFNRIELYPRSVTGTVYTFPKDFTIEVSSDGENWETVAKETDYPAVTYGNISFTFDAVTARYVRLNAKTLRPNPADTGRYRLQLAEFEIYNDIPQTIEAAAEKGIYICAICAAPSILGHKELLRGRRAVCFPGYEQELYGAAVQEAPVVVDGHIITAKGAGVAIEFALQIVSQLVGDSAAARLKASMQCR